MEEPRAPGERGGSPVPLYHVTAHPIPVGRVLLPYAIGREYATVLRLASSALREGSEALALLLAGDAWERLRGEAEHLPGGVVLRCVLDAGTAEEHDGAVVVEAFETADLTDPRPRDLQRVAVLAERYWVARAPMAFPELLVRGRVRVAGVITDEGGLDRFTDTP